MFRARPEVEAKGEGGKKREAELLGRERFETAVFVEVARVYAAVLKEESGDIETDTEAGAAAGAVGAAEADRVGRAAGTVRPAGVVEAVEAVGTVEAVEAVGTVEATGAARAAGANVVLVVVLLTITPVPVVLCNKSGEVVLALSSTPMQEI